jgi:hypothetical protein
MAYTTINKGKEHYHGKTYTGNGSTNNISTLDFAPDCIWIRRTNSNANWRFCNKITGVNKSLKMNSTVPITTDSGIVNSFDSNGFTLSTSNSEANSNGSNYLSFNFKGGGSGLTNTDGTITSTTSANTTSGFSLVTYTGNGTLGATVGHGLGYAPEMIIVKRSDNNGDWIVKHKNLGSNNVLKLTIPQQAIGQSDQFNSTNPNASVVTLGTNSETNANESDYVMMCFSNITGYCKIDSYKGNANTNGPFVYTGFKPKFIIIKNIQSAEAWQIFEQAVDSDNPHTKTLGFVYNFGLVDGADNSIDLLSNGFKIRTSDAELNGSNSDMMYIAIADYPIVGTNDVPGMAS